MQVVDMTMVTKEERAKKLGPALVLGREGGELKHGLRKKKNSFDIRMRGRGA